MHLYRAQAEQESEGCPGIFAGKPPDKPRRLHGFQHELKRSALARRTLHIYRLAVRFQG